MKKIYVYVDETGQDTLGNIFIVVSIIIQEQKAQIENKLKELELKTGKKLKWQKSKYTDRITFMKQVALIHELKNAVFWSEYKGSTSFKDLTALSIAKAIFSFIKDNYKAIVIVDGLNKSEKAKLGSTLRKLRVKTEKVLGINDEREIFLRLADAFAGLIRDAEEQERSAKKILEKLVEKDIVKKL